MSRAIERYHDPHRDDSPTAVALRLFRFGLRVANVGVWLEVRTEPVGRSKVLQEIEDAECLYPRGVA